MSNIKAAVSYDPPCVLRFQQLAHQCGMHSTAAAHGGDLAEYLPENFAA